MRIHSLLSWFERPVIYLNTGPSKRYLAGIKSYGKKVRTDKRKARIQAELKAMGVKIKVRRKMGRKDITPREYMCSIRNPKRMQTTRWLGKLTVVLVAFFLSSAAEATHGRYDIKVLSDVPARWICMYTGLTVRLCIPRSPFNQSHPPVRHQGPIWGPLPTEVLPYP